MPFLLSLLSMEYNTSRNQLAMPEYGRIIQELVETCKALETKQQRNEMAAGIIEFMGQRNPQLRDEEDYKHKLWEHLNILAGFDLEVDAPYPLKSREELAERPKKMDYPALQGDYKFYGKSILQLIEMAVKLENGGEKSALINVIANNMKKAYNVYNKEHVADEVIFRHLKELSQNRLDLTGIETLERSKIYYEGNNANRNRPQKNWNGRNKNYGKKTWKNA